MSDRWGSVKPSGVLWCVLKDLVLGGIRGPGVVRQGGSKWGSGERGMGWDGDGCLGRLGKVSGQGYGRRELQGALRTKSLEYLIWRASCSLYFRRRVAPRLREDSTHIQPIGISVQKRPVDMVDGEQRENEKKKGSWERHL